VSSSQQVRRTKTVSHVQGEMCVSHARGCSGKHPKQHHTKKPERCLPEPNPNIDPESNGAQLFVSDARARPLPHLTRVYHLSRPMGTLNAAAWVQAAKTASFCLWVLHGSVTFHARLARNPSNTSAVKRSNGQAFTRVRTVPCPWQKQQFAVLRL